MKKVAIIGGGITGLCSAYYLTKAGYHVTIVDKGTISDGASFINAGYVTPSHFVPIAEPGMINQGLKWMFNNSSPFYIKPRWDMEFFKWSWYFKRSSTRKKVEKAIPVLIDLNLRSRDLYADMLESLDFDFHMERKGLLMVYKSSKNEEHERKLAERAKELGLEVSVLDQKALHDLEPAFSDDVIGGVHYECDAHSTPNELMSNLKAWLKDHGVHFILEQTVIDLTIENHRIRSLKTEKQDIEADEFILAAGSWTSLLAKKLGLNIPIQPGKGYSMNSHRRTDINFPAILTEAKVAVTPMRAFTRFAGTMEFSGNNSDIMPNRVEAIAKAASSYYSNFSLTPEEKAEATSGLRPVSPDGLPFIGSSSKFQNLQIAAGHAMMGWSLGPVTGKLIADLVEKNTPFLSLDPFRPDRF